MSYRVYEVLVNIAQNRKSEKVIGIHIYQSEHRARLFTLQQNFKLLANMKKESYFYMDGPHPG